MYGCRPVGLEFCETAPHRFVAEVVVRATPEQIFDVFEDPDSWVVCCLAARE